MTQSAIDPIAAVNDLLETSQILLVKLKAADTDNGEAAHEAILVMLFQMLEYFGTESTAAQQLFPAMDSIKRRIDGENYVGALWDAETMIETLDQIRELAAAQRH